jgi:hypothetical protein
MIPQTSSFAQPNHARLPWGKALQPALKAAATWWLVFLFLAIVTLFTGWASRPVTLFLQLVASLGAGILAAWLSKTEVGGAAKAVRQGAFAGLYLPLASAAVVLIIAILAGISSLGALLPVMIPYFLFLPIEIGACSLCGALGSWIFQKLFLR